MLARVIARAMQLRFDREQARDLDATLELRLMILRGRRTMPLRVDVRGGGCTITPGAAADSGAQVSIGLTDMVRVAIGLVGWPQLLSSGGLELSGDPFLALRFPTLFRLRAIGSATDARK